MRRKPTRGREAALWALCLGAACVLGGLLIAHGIDQAKAPPFLEAQSADPGLPGRAYLDLDLLAQAFSPDEADNVRWSLVRRTPEAARMLRQDGAVDWEALRALPATGTILIPPGFAWSFNETFQQGPGYKEAGGVVAGGQCALATVFRAAAKEAGLPVEARPHARPVPGFAPEESVNIWWGRDDLVVRNPFPHDLLLIWSVSPERVEVAVHPATTQTPLLPLPDWQSSTVAMVYGGPGPSGWGSLGQTGYADHALLLARSYARRVDEWNDGRPVAVALNPNVAMAGQPTERENYLYYLIAEARRQGYYVMLDVQTGAKPPLQLFEHLIDQYLQENVWFDWDIEHTAGGRIETAQLNQAAAAYFARRQARGYRLPGIFGFYVFEASQVTSPGEVRRATEAGVTVPIFDGYGADKVALTGRVLSAFGEGPFGVMEFETRWASRYDQISARTYIDAFPDALIVAAQ